MIKFTGVNKGRTFLGICLTENNLGYLIADQPAHISAEDIGMSEFKVQDIVIFYSDTEEEFIEKLRGFGVVTDDTKIVNVDNTPH